LGSSGLVLSVSFAGGVPEPVRPAEPSVITAIEVMLVGSYLMAPLYRGSTSAVVRAPAAACRILVIRSVVSGCEARLGTRAVAHLIPVVALTITLPLAFLFGLIGGTVWVLAIVALDTTFTYAGARLLAHRYLRRTEGAPLH